MKAYSLEIICDSYHCYIYGIKFILIVFKIYVNSYVNAIILHYSSFGVY